VRSTDLEIDFPLFSIGFGIGASVLQAEKIKTNITNVEILVEIAVLELLNGFNVIIGIVFLE
jgi:hypothetical protein